MIDRIQLPKHRQKARQKSIARVIHFPYSTSHLALIRSVCFSFVFIYANSAVCSFFAGSESRTIYDGSLFKHKFWMDRFANFNTTFITIIFDQFFSVHSARILHDSFDSSLQQWLWVNCLIQCFDRAATVWTENDAEIALKKNASITSENQFASVSWFPITCLEISPT